MMKIKKNVYLILVAVLLCYQYQCLGQGEGNIVIGTKFKIDSKILNEERSYIVGLPKSYNNSTNTYPSFGRYNATISVICLEVGNFCQSSGYKPPSRKFTNLINNTTSRQTYFFELTLTLSVFNVIIRYTEMQYWHIKA